MGDESDQGPSGHIEWQGYEQFWHHEPGCEFLAANPIEIPGLSRALNYGDFNKDSSSLMFVEKLPPSFDNAIDNSRCSPFETREKSDPFITISAEISRMILEYLNSKDIANLRLASRFFQSLPTILFRRLLFEDMPWLWEAREWPVGKIDWYQSYMKIKFCWAGFKGIQNRKRIWSHTEEIVRRIQRYRKKGMIGT